MDRPKKRKIVAREVRTDRTKVKNCVLNTLLEAVEKTVSCSELDTWNVAIILAHFKEEMLKN